MRFGPMSARGAMELLQQRSRKMRGKRAGVTHETCLPSTKYSSFLRPICLLMVTSSRSLCTPARVTSHTLQCEAPGPDQWSRRCPERQNFQLQNPPAQAKAENARDHAQLHACADCTQGPSCVAMEVVAAYRILRWASKADAEAPAARRTCVGRRERQLGNSHRYACPCCRTRFQRRHS